MASTCRFSSAGVRVLVVDGDTTSSENLQKILKKCDYQVRTCNFVKDAVDMLGENNEIFRFEIVMTDVNMIDVDGFEFLRHVAYKLVIPVIMMSYDVGGTSKVMKGIECGACDFLVKPIRRKDVRCIWLHAYRKRIERGEMTAEIGDDALIVGKKRTKLVIDGDYSLSLKKPRVIWEGELQERFLGAVHQIEEHFGYNQVTPKKIFELMGVPWLTTKQINSHLQKYRLKRNKMDQKAAAPTEVSAGTSIYPRQPVVLHQNIAINKNCGQNVESRNQTANNTYQEEPTIPSLPSTNSQIFPKVFTNYQALPEQGPEAPPPSSPVEFFHQNENDEFFRLLENFLT